MRVQLPPSALKLAAKAAHFAYILAKVPSFGISSKKGGGMKKRAIYIINKIQRNYIIFFAGLALFSGGLTNWYFWHMMRNAYFYTKNPIKLLENFYGAFLSGYLIILVILIYFLIVISNRTFGPLFRIEQDLKKFLDGDKNKRIKLRPKDSFKELADNINKALDLATKK